jgi:hypothetical protein
LKQLWLEFYHLQCFVVGPHTGDLAPVAKRLRISPAVTSCSN